MTLAVKVALNPNPTNQLKRRYTPIQPTNRPTNLPSFAQCMGLIPTSLQLAQVLTALLPITRRQILDSSKLKEFADDNFKLDENGRKLSKQIENTVGKGEIARYEQFLLFPQCFQRACFPGVSKGVIVSEWVNNPPQRNPFIS